MLATACECVLITPLLLHSAISWFSSCLLLSPRRPWLLLFPLFPLFFSPFIHRIFPSHHHSSLLPFSSFPQINPLMPPAHSPIPLHRPELSISLRFRNPRWMINFRPRSLCSGSFRASFNRRTGSLALTFSQKVLPIISTTGNPLCRKTPRNGAFPLPSTLRPARV